MAFDFYTMKETATEAWGQLGSDTADRWFDFNGRFFSGKLQPIPLVITNTQPFGRRLAFCSRGCGRTITLNRPSCHSVLVAENASLLHEMIHQCLFERGEDPSHKSLGWRNEIMRIHRQLTGDDIWAGASTTARRKQNNGSSKVARINKSHPVTGALSLVQGRIASWPHSVGISLGELGADMELRVTAVEQVTDDNG
jgi:hypothetical protein